MSDRRSHIIASVVTLLAMLLLFLLLWFIVIGVPQPQEDEGIEVAFGDVVEAGGYQEQPSEVLPEEQPAPAPQAAAPSPNDLMTQEDEEALQLARQREQEEKARREAEAERLRLEREAQLRAEAEARERAEREAAEKAKRDAAIAKANAMAGLFGNNGSDAKGSGDGKGEGKKGNPVGHGSLGGSDWSLAGREAKTIPRPGNNFKQEGKVVVNIQVNADGQVTSATLGPGSTVSDATTIQLAIDAAKKAVFSKGDNAARGTITYNFRFN